MRHWKFTTTQELLVKFHWIFHPSNFIISNRTELIHLKSLKMFYHSDKLFPLIFITMDSRKTIFGGSTGSKLLKWKRKNPFSNSLTDGSSSNFLHLVSLLANVWTKILRPLPKYFTFSSMFQPKILVNFLSKCLNARSNWIFFFQSWTTISELFRITLFEWKLERNRRPETEIQCQLHRRSPLFFSIRSLIRFEFHLNRLRTISKRCFNLVKRIDLIWFSRQCQKYFKMLRKDSIDCLTRSFFNTVKTSSNLFQRRFSLVLRTNSDQRSSKRCDVSVGADRWILLFFIDLNSRFDVERWFNDENDRESPVEIFAQREENLGLIKKKTRDEI